MKSEKKITASEWNAQMRRSAERLIATGKMPSFPELCDAIVSSPAAQELIKMKLRRLAPGSNS